MAGFGFSAADNAAAGGFGHAVGNVFGGFGGPSFAPGMTGDDGYYKA